jgi:hypothetical protein
MVPLALMLAACAPQSAGAKRIAIVGAKLEGVEHSIVLVEGMTVIAAGPQASVPLPKDSQIVDGTGKTIEPAPGAKIAAGEAANLTLKDASSTRTMKDGQWQN